MKTKDKLDTLFHSASKCKEDGHDCRLGKNNVKHIYKPDAGLEDVAIMEKLFSHMQDPKLADCVVVSKQGKLFVIETKCGKVTFKLAKDVIEKITNVCRILKSKDIEADKLYLLYKSFESSKLRQRFQNEKVFGIKIIEKKFSNQAVEI